MSEDDESQAHSFFSAGDCGVFCSAERQTGKQAAPAKQNLLPALSAQEIFKRVSPSVMVVESLDASGKVTKLGSGVVIAPGCIITNRHVIKDGVNFRGWRIRRALCDVCDPHQE